MLRLRVKELAEEKGFNQSSLSRASGLGFNTIKGMYRDPYRNVERRTLEKVADALGVTVAELYEEEPDDSEK